MKRILCVCYGNTCRSPMLQALLTRELKNRGVEAVVESAGILACNGAPANEKAVICMREMGLDIADHLSRGISGLNSSDYDKILCLANQVRPLLLERGISPKKIDFIEVNNPYGKNLKAYRTCAKILARTVKKIAKEIANQ